MISNLGKNVSGWRLRNSWTNCQRKEICFCMHIERKVRWTLISNCIPMGNRIGGLSNCVSPQDVHIQERYLIFVFQVKTERLTPDNNSTSSRSVTPSSSSHPGTPPNATPLGGPEGPPPPHHLKHMEQMMGRNYSDFMRSLAAKYNNANPNEWVACCFSESI